MARRAAGFVIYRLLEDSVPPVQYLLMQTSYGHHHWTPPKGHLDPGEDDMTAAVRETVEEAGIAEDKLEIHKDIKQELRYVAGGNPAHPAADKVVTYWLAKLRDPNTLVVLSEEHQDYKWLGLEEACELGGYKDFAQALRNMDQARQNMT